MDYPFCVLSTPSESNRIYRKKKEEIKIYEWKQGFPGIISLKNKKCLQRWPLSISLIPCLVHALSSVLVLLRQTQKWKQKQEKRSQDVRISSDIHWAWSAAAKKTRGLHQWEASIQQHKVIVLKSIVAWWSAYWQSPQLDSSNTAASTLCLSSFSVPIARRNC